MDLGFFIIRDIVTSFAVMGRFSSIVVILPVEIQMEGFVSVLNRTVWYNEIITIIELT